MTIERMAVRVILLDPDDRILLFGARDPQRGRVVWVTPGGGVEVGEDHLKAAQRELFEETGLTGIELAGPIWRRSHDFTWDGHELSQTEFFFVGRATDTAAIDTSGMGMPELKYHVDKRWFSVQELRTLRDDVAPRRLATLLPPILAGDLPSGPLDTGI